ncbi:MAG TPA: CHASE3 domain-containing protein [Chthoniobacter sp.]|nr:CHASE3 domain-containing protein [Chthoniobacter sp.]
MSRISIWQRIPLRVQGLVFNSLPLVAVLITAVFAYYSNQQREHTELSLARHYEVVESLVDVQTSLLNASAGLRGYMLTHDPSMLQPARDARTLIPQKLAHVRALMDTIQRPLIRTQKLARLDAVEKQASDELEVLTNLYTAETGGASAQDISAQILRNQPLLEFVGQQLSSLRASEQRLFARRIDEIRSIRQRDYLLIFLSVFIGLVSRAVALYFFHRRVIRRVRQLTENVRSLRDGATLVHEPSDHADDIGELERELARASEFLTERRIGS